MARSTKECDTGSDKMGMRKKRGKQCVTVKVSKGKVNEQGGGNAGEDDASEEDEPDHIVKLSKGGEHKGKYLVRWKKV